MCRTGPVPRGDLISFASTHFANFVGLVAPERSWVARLIGKDVEGTPNGVYAEALSDEDALDEEDLEDNYDEEEFEEAVETAAQEKQTISDAELLGLI